MPGDPAWVRRRVASTQAPLTPTRRPVAVPARRTSSISRSTVASSVAQEQTSRIRVPRSPRDQRWKRTAAASRSTASPGSSTKTWLASAARGGHPAVAEPARQTRRGGVGLSPQPVPEVVAVEEAGKLDAQQPPLGEQRAALLHVVAEVAPQLVVDQDDGLSAERPVLGSPGEEGVDPAGRDQVQPGSERRQRLARAGRRRGTPRARGRGHGRRGPRARRRCRRRPPRWPGRGRSRPVARCAHPRAGPAPGRRARGRACRWAWGPAGCGGRWPRWRPSRGR